VKHAAEESSRVRRALGRPDSHRLWRVASREQDGWLPVALEFAMRSVADGSSASGPSVNGRSRLTGARCHSGLHGGNARCHREGMTECCQRFKKDAVRRRNGGPKGAMRAQGSDGGQRQQEMSAGRAAGRPRTEILGVHMHNSLAGCRCGLIQMYPRYMQKVPRWYRSASSHCQK
jgi:hypothetical protein